MNDCGKEGEEEVVQQVDESREGKERRADRQGERETERERERERAGLGGRGRPCKRKKEGKKETEPRKERKRTRQQGTERERETWQTAIAAPRGTRPSVVSQTAHIRAEMPGREQRHGKRDKETVKNEHGE